MSPRLLAALENVRGESRSLDFLRSGDLSALLSIARNELDHSILGPRWRNLVEELETFHIETEDKRSLWVLTRFHLLRGDTSALNSLLMRMRSSKTCLFRKTYREVIDYYWSIEAPHDAARTILDMLQAGHNPYKHREFLSHYRRLLDLGLFDEAIKIFQCCESRGVYEKTWRSMCISATYSFSMAGKMEEAAQICDSAFQRCTDATARQILLRQLIFGYIRVKDMPAATRRWNQMLELRISPDIKLYGALIHGHVQQTDMDTAISLYNAMRENGLRPNEYVYTSLIHGYATRGDMDKALHCFDQMRAEGMCHNLIAYVCIVHGYVLQGKMEEARTWFDRLYESQLMPNVYAFTTLIDGYMRRADVDNAERLFSEMKRAGAEPNLVTYNAIIHSSTQKLDMRTAESFYLSMMKAGVKPDIYTYAILLKGFLRNRDLRRAWRIFRKMSRNPSVKLNEVMATSIAELHMEAKDYVGAIDMLARFFSNKPERGDDRSTNDSGASIIQNKYPVPSFKSYTTLLNARLAFASRRDIHVIYEQFAKQFRVFPTPKPIEDKTTTENTLSVTCPKDAYMHTTFIRHFLRHNDLGAAYRVLEDMRHLGITPTVATYTCLMRGHLYARDIDGAMRAMTQMQSEGIKPNVITYTSLIDGLSRMGEIKRARNAVLEMKEAGIEPNAHTYRALRRVVRKEQDERE
ncbi:uncharacterized protein VTP21DRAFT_3529 [Calcarisporiella thermophila]|uniref:uncharacterized protein n=1 Tax=Calcarisporiella thermophila TaxID=911321 RepID=UPI003741FED2